jgi:hypothetical protein
MTVWGAQTRFRLQIGEFTERNRVNATPQVPLLTQAAVV